MFHCLYSMIIRSTVVRHIAIYPAIDYIHVELDRLHTLQQKLFKLFCWERFFSDSYPRILFFIALTCCKFYFYSMRFNLIWIILSFTVECFWTSNYFFLSQSLYRLTSILTTTLFWPRIIYIFGSCFVFITHSLVCTFSLSTKVAKVDTTAIQIKKISRVFKKASHQSSNTWTKNVVTSTVQ